MISDRDISRFHCRYFEVIESQSQKFGMPQNLSLMYSKVIQVGFAFEVVCKSKAEKGKYD